MGKYLLVRSVFCPNYDHFKKSFRGIINTADFVTLQGINRTSVYDLLVIGYTKQQFTNNIRRICEWKNKAFNKVFIDIFGINWGKYEILNRLANYIGDYDGILFMDHDIVLPLSDPKMVSKLDIIANSYIDNKPVGFVGLNQDGDCRHQPTIYENWANIEGIDVVFPNRSNYGAIGSGCFFGLSHILLQVLPFKKISVYGLDDYHLCKKLVKIGYQPVVTPSMSIFHAGDGDNEKYKVWKRIMVLKCMSNNVSYLSSVQDATNFWNGF